MIEREIPEDIFCGPHEDPWCLNSEEFLEGELEEVEKEAQNEPIDIV